MAAKYGACLDAAMVRTPVERLWPDLHRITGDCGMNLVRTMLGSRYLVNAVRATTYVPYVRCYNHQTDK